MNWVKNAFRVDQKRDASIETLRGLACLLLVAYHVIGSNATEGIRVPDDSVYRWFSDTFIYLRMPLFTFLSGFVYAMRPAHSGTRLLGFIRGKWRRLLVPMFFFGTIFALSQTFLPGANGEVNEPWYLWNIIPVGPYWFLASMALIFAVVAVAEKCGFFLRLPVVLVSFGVLTLADAVVPDAVNWFGWRTALYLFPFFLAGLAARRFEWRDSRRSLHVGVVVVAVGLFAYAQAGVLDIVPALEARHTVLATVLGSALCLSLLLVRVHLRLLVFIGAFSFSIYAMQIFGVGVVRLGLSRAGVDDLNVTFLACLAAGIALPILVEAVARRSAWLSFLLLGARFPVRSGQTPKRGNQAELGL